MRLIKSKVEILDKLDGQAILERIEQVARTCYKSESKYGYEFTTDDGLKVIVDETEQDKQETESKKLNTPSGKKVSITANKLVKRLIDSKHEAMLEFVDITVKFTCSRSIAQEITRHRLASFAMESQRYCAYNKDKFRNEVTFVLPSWVNDDESTELFIQTLKNTELTYFELLNKGLKAQEAREILPNATKTELNMKANLREWRHFFNLRCSQAAHPDIRVLALDLLKQFHEVIPIIFDDLYDKYYAE